MRTGMRVAATAATVRHGASLRIATSYRIADVENRAKERKNARPSVLRVMRPKTDLPS
jgi:hypothetical protein